MASLALGVRFNPTSNGTGDFVSSGAVTGYRNASVLVDGKTYRYRAESADLSQWEYGYGTWTAGTSTLARTTVLFSNTGSKINFTLAPQVSIIIFPEDVIQFDDAMSLTVAQQAMGRSNISASGLAAMAMKNAIANAALDVSQENGATGYTLANNTARYTADQWVGHYNHGAATANVTCGQFAIASIGVPLAGFQLCHKLSAGIAISAPASLDFAKHLQFIEGNRIAHWGWGTAGAATISIAFQLYSVASGTAFVRLSNGATANRFYYHEITVAAGWNFYAFTVAGDTSGTWATDNTKALTFEVFSSGKETTPQASLDSWGSTPKVQTTNSTNLLGTNGNGTFLTGVYMDANGGQLPSATELPLVMRSFDQELQLCQRYWCKSYDYTLYAGDTSANGSISAISGYAVAGAVPWIVRYGFPVQMRSSPTVTVYATVSGTASRIREPVAAVDRTIDNTNVNNQGVQIYSAQFNYSVYGSCHVIADARL